MQIKLKYIDKVCPESEIWERYLALEDADILELGCGAAELTRQVAISATGCRITALEVDMIQHDKNLQAKKNQSTDLANVRFIAGGAEAIPLHDASFDIVLMFKSLHHVPIDEMDRALDEIHRVLKPGGLAYISEPIFAGDFNEILRLFHDEEEVRKAAFEAVKRAVEDGRFALVDEVFFSSHMHFADFTEFEHKVIGVSHTFHKLSDAVREPVRQAFNMAVNGDGAHFLMPMRVDVLEAIK